MVDSPELLEELVLGMFHQKQWKVVISPWLKMVIQFSLIFLIRILEVKVSSEELAQRKANWKMPLPKVTSGYLARYARMVTSASTGAV